MTISKSNLSKLSVIAFAIFYSQLANASFASKFVSKLNNFSDELTIIGAGILVLGIVLWAIFMMGGTANPKVKTWGIGLFFGGVIVILAPDIGSTIVGL